MSSPITSCSASSTDLAMLSTSGLGSRGAVAFTPALFRCDFGRSKTASITTFRGSPVSPSPAARAAAASDCRYACTGCWAGTYARANPPLVETRGLGCGTGSPGTENVIDMPAWWRACQAGGLCSTDSGGGQRHAAGRRGIGGVLCSRPAAIGFRILTGSQPNRSRSPRSFSEMSNPGRSSV